MSREFVITIIVLLFFIPIKSQTVFFNFGQNFEVLKTVNPVVNQVEALENRKYFSVEFNYPVKDKLFIGFEAGFLKGWSSFRVDAGTWGGNGTSITNLVRFSPFIGYDLLSKRENCRFLPFVKLVIEKSISTWDGEAKTEIGPPTSMEYLGTILITNNERWQMAPSLGCEFNWNPFWKLNTHISTSYIWGITPFQEMEFQYSYKGSQVENAKWFSDGSGLIVYLGIGIELW
jgi:hypothetical protein